MVKKKKHKKKLKTEISKVDDPIVIQEKDSRRLNISKLELMTWISAAVILVIGILIRSYAFSMPVVGDESVYGILGEKAMMGAALYRDIYEMKPPLLFYVYGISTAIFGWGTSSLRIIGLILVMFNSLMIFKIARTFTTLSFSALVGSICFFFLNNLYAYTTETAAEHFYMAFVLTGYYLLIEPKFKRISLNIFIAGFLIAGAAMIKQTAALFGLGAIVLIIWYSLIKDPYYSKKMIFKSILFLALGAFLMIALNILPILISGTLAEARYWLIDVPTKYSTSNSLGDNWINLEVLGMRILNYQFTTIILAIIGIASLVVNYRAKYIPLIVIMCIVSIIIIFPGFRFYCQYWIPLLTILALSLVSLKDAVEKLNSKAAPILAALVLTTVMIDTLSHTESYFEKGYMKNAEIAYSGNFPNVHVKVAEYLKSIMKPTEQFLMLGSQPFTYYAIDQFPSSDHIYPRLIFRNTPENKAYQEQAIKEMRNGNHDYILISITGLAWKTDQDGIDNWYNNAFSYVNRNYTPILAYNFDERKYYYNNPEDRIDLYKPNQLLALKKR